jgi:hypothetical protein
MTDQRYSTAVNYIVLTIALILLLDLFTSCVPDMTHHLFKHFTGPRGLQNILILIFFVGVVVWYFLKKESTIPFFQDEQSQTCTGTVQDFHVNGAGDIDGITIINNGKFVLLRFPPHVAFRVLEVASAGEHVTATFVNRNGRKHKKNEPTLESIADKSGKVINLNNMLPHLSLSNEEQIEIILSDRHFSMDKKGKKNGFISGKYFIEIKPHIMQELLPLILQAKTITIQGMTRDSMSGFVNFYKRDVIRATAIELDSITYTLY